MINKMAGKVLPVPTIITHGVVVTFGGRSSALPLILRRCKFKNKNRNGKGLGTEIDVHPDFIDE